MTNNVHVLVADSHPLSRAGLQNELAKYYQVSDCADIQQAYLWLPEKTPDVVFLGSNLPAFGLPDTLVEWQSCFVDGRFIIMLSHEEEVDASRLLASGAVGCLLKSEVPEQFIQAVVKEFEK